MGTKIDLPLKVGLFLVSLALFLYMMYEFTNGIINRGPLEGEGNFFILVTDVPGCIGMASRAAAGLIAVVALLFYFSKNKLSRPELFMAARLVVLFEAGYWFLSFFMSGVMGLVGIIHAADFSGTLLFTIENTLPCFLQSIGLVSVLLKLFLELSPNKPLKSAIKWSLIAGTFYIFVFWLNNTGNWTAALMDKGTEYIIAYPANMFSFLLSTVGLLLLGLYAAYFTKKCRDVQSLSDLNWHVIGSIITLVGLYFGVHYIMYIFLGAVGGWGTWYAWMLGHNLDLWAMSLPLLGLPLLFRMKASESATKT